MTDAERAVWALGGTPRLDVKVQGTRWASAIYDAVRASGFPPEVLLPANVAATVVACSPFMGTVLQGSGYWVFGTTKVYVEGR